MGLKQAGTLVVCNNEHKGVYINTFVLWKLPIACLHSPRPPPLQRGLHERWGEKRQAPDHSIPSTARFPFYNQGHPHPRARTHPPLQAVIPAHLILRRGVCSSVAAQGQSPAIVGGAAASPSLQTRLLATGIPSLAPLSPSTNKPLPPLVLSPCRGVCPSTAAQGQPPAEPEVQKLVSDADVDGDGTIGYEVRAGAGAFVGVWGKEGKQGARVMGPRVREGERQVHKPVGDADIMGAARYHVRWKCRFGDSFWVWVEWGQG